METNSQHATGEHSGASPCSQYIPFMDTPDEIHASAKILHRFFEIQGMSEWEFSAVADRRLVVKLKRENERLLKAMDDIEKIAASACNDPTCKCTAGLILHILANAEFCGPSPHADTQTE